MPAAPPSRVVLVGAGHTHAHILRMWGRMPIPETRLTCVSNHPTATYSGMLPGVLARQYPSHRMEIDLAGLCKEVGASLEVANFTGLDLNHRQLLFDDRDPLSFDVLSIGIGSVPSHAGASLDPTVIPIKPMQTFVTRLERRVVEQVQQHRVRLLRVVVVGTGLGGVEIALCLPPRLVSLLRGTPFHLTLVGSNRLAEGTTPRTEALLTREFQSRGVDVRLGARVNAVGEGAVVLDDGKKIAAELVLWATNAAGPPALRGIDLPKDRQGFLLTRPTLQSIADEPVFAVGDTGTVEGSTTPKAGVYAVRQGPVLWANLARLIRRRELLEYHPQPNFLKIINLGNNQAIAEYKGLSIKGRLAWRLKNWIDTRFMSKYQNRSAGRRH